MTTGTSATGTQQTTDTTKTDDKGSSSAGAAGGASALGSITADAKTTDAKAGESKGTDEKGADVGTQKTESDKGADKAAELELKLPDGFKADEKELAEFKALAKDVGLDSAKAQKVFDKFLSREQARNAAAEAAYDKQVKGWEAELAKEFGFGDPKKWAESDTHLKRLFNHKTFGPLALATRDQLHSAGLGSMPSAVKLLIAMGRGLADDSVAGTSAAPSKVTKPSDAELFYGPATGSKSKEQ